MRRPSIRLCAAYTTFAILWLPMLVICFGSAVLGGISDGLREFINFNQDALKAFAKDAKESEAKR